MPQNSKIAAYVGKFHTNGAEKGIPEIIKAVGLLLKINQGLDFYFVGGPTSRTALYDKIVDQNGVNKSRLKFLGKQPIQHVPLWLKAADILSCLIQTEFYTNMYLH